MPLFEFICNDCGEQFEEIVRGGSTPRCPSCNSTELRRLISTFAVGGSSPRASSAAPSAPIGGG